MKRMTQVLAITLALFPAAQALAEATAIDVRKTNGCGCCLLWMEHLEENGFVPTGQDMNGGLLVRFKLDMGVPQRMVSCHTALVDGYVIEGHVPAELVEKLRARGINTSSQTRIDAVIDYDQKGVDGALRISPHYFNDDSDLDALIGALTEIVT